MRDVAGKPLSRREAQMVALVSRGWSNRQIADELDVADQTVKNYLSSAMRKTGCRNRTALAVWRLRRPYTVSRGQRRA